MGAKKRALLLIGGFLVWFASASCVDILPVQNIPPVAPPARTLLREQAGARFYAEEGLAEAAWLEVDRVGEPGAVGGYLARAAEAGDALIVMLHGASSYAPGGSVEAARNFHENVGIAYRLQGFTTWSLAVRECGTAYGQDDLADVFEAIDWLDRDGKEVLGVERVYIVGYSTGGTLATLANRQRASTAVVALGALTQGDQFDELFDLYQWLGALFPQNEGLCQLRSTLEIYGPPGAPGWENLNTVDHLEELRNPQLFVHAVDDFVFSVDNARNLQQRYEETLANGGNAPDLQFIYIEGASHFDPPTDYPTYKRIIDYLLRFEPQGRVTGP